MFQRFGPLKHIYIFNIQRVFAPLINKADKITIFQVCFSSFWSICKRSYKSKVIYILTATCKSHKNKIFHVYCIVVAKKSIFNSNKSNGWYHNTLEYLGSMVLRNKVHIYQDIFQIRCHMLLYLYSVHIYSSNWSYYCRIPGYKLKKMN